MREQEIQELINKIRQLSFSCVDDGEEAVGDRIAFEHGVEQGIIPFIGKAEQLIPILDTESGYAALGEWLKDLKNFDKAHLALHYGIMGVIIDRIRNAKVNETTIEAFNENTQCMKEVALVAEIRTKLLAEYDKGEPERKLKALKERIQSSNVFTVCAAVLISESSYRYIITKHLSEAAIRSLLKTKLDCDAREIAEMFKGISYIYDSNIERILENKLSIQTRGYL